MTMPLLLFIIYVKILPIDFHIFSRWLKPPTRYKTTNLVIPIYIPYISHCIISDFRDHDESPCAGVAKTPRFLPPLRPTTEGAHG